MNLSAIIEFVHAIAMVLSVASLPLLFYHRWPKLSLVVACYNLFFIIVNRVSHWLLGECILTRLARLAGGTQDDEWFTVKFSRLVCGFIPSNKQVTYVEQALVVLVVLGVFYTLWWRRR